MTVHANKRAKERGISPEAVREALLSGEIIETYEDDEPYPSCLILGYTKGNKPIHLVVSDNGETALVITVYYPNLIKWESDFKTRKA